MRERRRNTGRRRGGLPTLCIAATAVAALLYMMTLATGSPRPAAVVADSGQRVDTSPEH